MNPSLSFLLLLLLGLSQTDPIMEEHGEPEDLEGENEADNMDITTRILTTNNVSKEFLLEGDLIAPQTRNALLCLDGSCLWKKSRNGYVTIPYTVSNTFSSSDRQLIANALKSFHESTCIRFVARRNEHDFINIENLGGCYSYLGREGGGQVLSLNSRGCLHHGIIQHELNHALGFQHEQTRSDRDSYVRINWENIIPYMAYNFHRQNTNNLDTPYDYSSIMHYGRTTFAVSDGLETITPIPNPKAQIGQRRGMSRFDIQRINRLYRC